MADLMKPVQGTAPPPNVPSKSEPTTASEPPQEPPSLTFLIAVVVVLFLGLLIALSASFFKQIFANFGSYRCNPLLMPFAGFFGYNASENFQFCLNGILEGRLNEAFSPVFKMLGTFGSTLESVVNAALGLRNVFTNFLITVNGFIANVTRRIQSLMTQVRLSFLKMKELMGKVYGTMYAVIWMGTSGLAAANNVANNDLVKFMMEFCFAPATEVQRADGSWTSLDSLQIGDCLASLSSSERPRVTSVFRFDGTRTPLVRIGDVVVSAAHYVEHDGEWMEASDHPDAIPLPSLPVLCCLNVTGHRFLVGRKGLLAADYDEDDSEETIQTTQALALCTLNGTKATTKEPVDYSLGLCGDAEVRREDGTWTRIADLRIGDVVAHSGAVKGTVQEECALVVDTPIGPLAAAQLVFAEHQWTRAHRVYPMLPTSPSVLYQLVTEHCGALEVRGGGSSLFLRDYREVAIPEMEAAYANKITQQNRCRATAPPTVLASSDTPSNKPIGPREIP